MITIKGTQFADNEQDSVELTTVWPMMTRMKSLPKRFVFCMGISFLLCGAAERRAAY